MTIKKRREREALSRKLDIQKGKPALRSDKNKNDHASEKGGKRIVAKVAKKHEGDRKETAAKTKHKGKSPSHIKPPQSETVRRQEATR